MIKSTEVRQILPQKSIADRLADRLENLQMQGYKIISIHETKVSTPRDCTDQGFIIIYDTGEEEAEKRCDWGCAVCDVYGTRECYDCHDGSRFVKKEENEEDEEDYLKDLNVYSLEKAIPGDCFHGEIWVKCPHCGKAHEISYGCHEKDGYNIIKCNNCGKLFKDLV